MDLDRALLVEKAGGGSADIKSYWERAKSGHSTPYLFVSLVGLKVFDPKKILTMVSKGLPIETLARFQKNTLFSTSDIGELVAIAPRTLHRRKEQGRLAPEESDRLLRVTRLFAKALELFEGDVHAARTWFQTRAKALGGESPFRLAQTDLGAREVEALIDRLEQGVLT
jgi:putative toxin-antitoxin system antitoxin component (TIGR02293 family)